MASIYYEHVQDQDRDFLVTAKELACDIDQLNAMMLVTEAQYNIDVQRAEITVLRENGTYDDYAILLKEAQQQADNNRKGIIQSILEWFSRMFQHLANIFAKSNSRDMSHVDPNTPMYVDADAMDDSEDDSIFDAISKMSGIQKAAGIGVVLASLAGAGFLAKKFITKNPGDKQQDQQDNDQVQTTTGQGQNRLNVIQKIIEGIKKVQEYLSSKFKNFSDLLTKSPEELNSDQGQAEVQQADNGGTPPADGNNGNNQSGDASGQPKPPADQNDQKKNKKKGGNPQKKGGNPQKKGGNPQKKGGNPQKKGGNPQNQPQNNNPNNPPSQGQGQNNPSDQNVQNVNTSAIDEFIFGDTLYEADAPAANNNTAQPANNQQNGGGGIISGIKNSVFNLLQRALTYFGDKAAKLDNALASVASANPEGTVLGDAARFGRQQVGNARQNIAAAQGLTTVANMGVDALGNLMTPQQQQQQTAQQGQVVNQSAYDNPLGPNDISLYEAVFGTRYEEDFEDSSFDRELRAVFADI